MTDAPEQLVPLLGGARSTPALASVGGKALSLIRMAATGLPVPPGVVLTTAFFAPWLEAIRASSAWRAFTDAAPAAWPAACQELKRLCTGLATTPAQAVVLGALRQQLPALEAGGMFAVRSSSPEEDLVSASFAGGYATRLGVRGPELEGALRDCFASAFDERVLVYKRAHGFDVRSPRIAVVVQQQLASDVAGVAFSANPLTNDLDEAVVDACFGLGEAVVAGLTSPDHFVVDKVGGEVLERRLGAKRVSLWLGPDGGTLERIGHRAGEPSLSDGQLAEIVRTVSRIEALYERPMDVEWAWADGRLHVLQARPISTWVPLPPEMATAPGEPRRLYADAALSQGMTLNAPISPLGLSWIVHVLYAGILKRWAGIEDFTPAGGLVFGAGCRFYMNVSNAMWLGMTPRTMARNAAATDALLAEVMAGIDAKRYRAAQRPRWLRFGLLLFVPRALWAVRGLLWNTLVNVVAPQRGHRRFVRDSAAFEAELVGALEDARPVPEFAQRYTERLWPDMFDVTLPAVFAGLVSAAFLIPRRREEERALAERLRRGFTGNLVVEQGLALFRLARLLGPGDLDDLPGLTGRIARREMPAAFTRAWDEFVQRFGCRGPHEMDPASSRYGDDPLLALQQMASMDAEAGFDPERAHARNVEERRRAFQVLLERVGWPRRALLRRIHTLIELFGGARDTPKYHTVLLTHAVRRRALREGAHLVGEGRLDAPEDVFGLTLHDLEAAAADPALDLRALRAQRTAFAKRAAHVTAFPQVLDSRGRILRPPPREGRPGELVGMPVSPGAVTGRVKVLSSPREKRVEPGDVLVAYTTDPGWTPLFVNAAAVVLEVGGVLQHGAVIAREYGKPCVAGIDRVTSRLRDGQRVEVDGTGGVVRVLDEADRPAAPPA